MGSEHTPSGRWKYGIVLSLFAALLWGMLPIGLQAMMYYMDPYSIIWYRFLFAGVVLFIVLTFRKGLPNLWKINIPQAILLIIALIGLCSNYILYMLGLGKTSPGAAQVLIQLAPVLVILGGVILFKEEYSRCQLLGLIFILLGFTLFFHHKLDEIVSSFNEYSLGVILIIVSAGAWAAYALAQKQLLKLFNSQQILLVIYFAGVVLYLPKATPYKIMDLDTVGLLLLTFCGANTLLAYGCFAEALDHWEASRVSAVLAVIPLLTLVFMELTVFLYPGFIFPEKVSLLSFWGAIVVVAGSILVVMKNTEQKELIQ